MADIFLSYSSQDRERVRPLVQALERLGWSVWWDRKIPAGKTYDQVIEQALDEAQCVVVVWSQHSVLSEWVKVEADEGANRQILIPVLIDEARIPLAYRRIQAARLIDWQGDASHHELESLFDAIRGIVPEHGSMVEATSQPPKRNQPPMPAPPANNERLPSSAVTSSRLPSQNFIEDLGQGVNLEMIYIPSGEFLMGSNDDDSEQPIHLVKLSPFFIGQYQITQAQWRAIAGLQKVKLDLEPAPSNFKGDDHPVERVSWNEAVEFCARLSRKTGKSYRLPSEAEWEMACRAGTTGDYAGDLDAMAWYRNNSGGRTHPVGEKQPNAFGIFDMHGNVWEWCEDVWHDNYQKAPTDGSAWLSDGDSSLRVLRGGSWSSYGSYCRSALRDSNLPSLRYISFGFRVVVSARTSSP